MCGIIAIAGNKSLKDSQINGMLSALSLRGPDDIGFERFPGGVIGQTRLSIVDLVSGHQPMRDNTNPYSIVFNGEIYGYRDLRVALEKRGHKFRTTSDTEVILKSYAEYGRDCVKHLDGMFAFAIWDDTKKELFTARDRFGNQAAGNAVNGGVARFRRAARAITGSESASTVSLAGRARM